MVKVALFFKDIGNDNDYCNGSNNLMTISFFVYIMKAVMCMKAKRMPNIFYILPQIQNYCDSNGNSRQKSGDTTLKSRTLGPTL